MDRLLENGSLGEVSVWTLLLRMSWALGLGALLAWRPLSRLAGAPPRKPDIAHALLLITIASSLVIVIIGDSLARAFGVVGLGSFVRFRAAIKDPADVVLFFAAIGIGMACGLGLVAYAIVGVTVLSGVLVFRDRSRLRKAREALGSEARDTLEMPA